MVAGGLKSRKRAIMELSHCSEAEAERQLAEIAAETWGTAVTGTGTDQAGEPAAGDVYSAE